MQVFCKFSDLKSDQQATIYLADGAPLVRSFVSLRVGRAGRPEGVEGEQRRADV